MMLPNGNPTSSKRGSDGRAATKNEKNVSTLHPPSNTHPASSTPKSHQVHSQSRSWFATPAPIKRLFAQFPLQTLPANPLPSCRHDDANVSSCSRSKGQSSQEKLAGDLPVLHIFTTSEAAAQGAPSFNPSCLQHQTWLRAKGVQTRVVCSSNHAAPTGVLPFLVLTAKQRIVPAAKIWDWAEDHKGGNGGDDKSKNNSLRRAREAVYLSLIEHRLRAAWVSTILEQQVATNICQLLALYLTPSNFAALCKPLYIDPTTTSGPVRAALASSLRSAAVTALYALSPPSATAPQHNPPSVLPVTLVGEAFPTTQDAERIYAAASEALEALSQLLGNDAWFFGTEQPGRLDVVLFSYVHLMLDESIRESWADRRLIHLLQAKGLHNLLKHRERILTEVWGSDATVVAPNGL